MSEKDGATAAAIAAAQTDRINSGSGVLLVETASGRPLIKAVLEEAECLVVAEVSEPGQAISLARSLRPFGVLLHAAPYPAAAFDVTRALTVERIAPVVWFGASQLASSLTASAAQAGAMGFLSLPLRPVDVKSSLTLARTRFLELAELEAEVKNLNERMEARKLVGRAKAVLMERFRLTEREAFRRIQAQSATLNKPVHEIARAIITASEIAL